MDPITAGIVAGGVGVAGTLLTNQQSVDAANKQMKFQEKMSSTAHQREVEDLRKAGLNPILSALGAGSSTPAGAQPNISDVGPQASKAAEIALQKRAQDMAFQKTGAEIGNIQADTLNKTATANLIREQTASTAKDVSLKDAQTKKISTMLEHELKKAQAEGRWAEANQIMGLIQAGASTASDVIGLGLTGLGKKALQKSIEGATKKPGYNQKNYKLP